MRQIEQLLIVRVRVNGGHLRVADTKVFMNDFRHGRQAIRRTGSIRDDVMRGRIILVFVDTQHNRDVFILCRR